ncbi:MAG: CHAT domain-containing protein [Acidobacteria bacterium]|nr:CHAT domain-containing protein [Acidobacteriota bacterium]
MPFALRLSLCFLALSMSLVCSVISLAQSSSSPFPNVARSAAESDLRALVEKYFILYAGKDLDGLLSLWSEKSPDYASFKQELQERFANDDFSFGIPAISRLKVEGERASLRATADLTAINLRSRQKRELRIARNIALVREDGKWKVWRSAPAENDLAEVLAKSKTEAERAGLLADEKELASPELALALSYQGDRFYAQGDYSQALSIYRLEQSLVNQIGDKAGIARAFNDIGGVHLMQGDYALALEAFQMALTMSESQGNKASIGGVLHNIGLVQLSQGDYMQALERFQKCLTVNEEIGDKAAIGIALGSIGLVHYEQGDYAQALESHQKSLAIRESLGDKTGIASALNNIGRVYRSKGDYARALEHYQKSMRLDEALGRKYGLAVSLHNIGNVQRFQGNYAQALESFQKSLALREILEDKAGIALALNNIGHIYRLQGDYAQALERFQRGLSLSEALGNKAQIATAFNSIGRVHNSQGNRAQAIEDFQKSLTMREALGDKAGIADTLNDIGEVYEAQGRYSQALDSSSRAAALAGQIGYREALWKASLTAGAAYRALNQLARARTAFEEAITTIEALRANVVGGVGEQQRFFESKVFPYHSMVDLLTHEGRPAEALIFAERAKSRALLDVLRTGRVNVTKAMTVEEQEQERKLNGQLVALNTQISRETARQKPDQDRLTELKAQLQKARLDFEAFQTNLYAIHPELGAQRGEVQPLKLEEATGLLPDATSALLEYVVTDDVTYLFVVSRPRNQAAAETKVFTIPIKQTDLAKQIESFRRQLADRNLGVRAPARKLYDLLLKPARALLGGKSSLVIVPDDRLWELPFQALIDEKDRYLIERSAVSYAPSLTVLREMWARSDKRRGEAAPSTLLALGNPLIGKETVERASFSIRDGKLYPLPEAETEVRALGRLYGERRSKVYVGAEAREDRFKAEARQARIIHFATHGVLNNAAPLYSYLALARGDKNEDGLLEAWELMQLDLKADLAVLSACETARGRTSAGEGVIGLTWALFVAGTPATVVSQWEVESASTRDLMLGFHRQLQAPRVAGKLTKAESLRRAALKLMKNPKTNHPFYWAGFVLVGDNR